MKARTIVAALVAGIACAAGAAVKIGEVGTDFSASLKYAEEHNVPIVVTWGNTSCGYCNSLSKAVGESADVSAWIAEHKILFVEKHEDYDSKDADYIAARNWIKSINKSLNGFPYMGIYWKKADGSVPVKTAFTARKNQLPCSTPKNQLDQQVIGTMEMYIGDYKGGDTPVPVPGESGDAAFVTADTENDRLEASPETESVFVPLRRTTTGKTAGNRLGVRYPDGTETTIDVVWAAGESTKYVEVPMPAKFAKGKTITLTLRDTSGTRIDSSLITLVAEPANSPENPHWVGEYAARELPYGEWTLDYETAKEKLTTQGGYMIAVFSGVKWCPYCLGIDNSLFADKKFYSWAKKNKVILTLFDQPRWNSTDGCQYVGPRLLSFDNTFGKSGASYLSRKGLRGDDGEVLAAMNRQWELTQKWLAPESTASRLSNPTILLLDATGTQVAARYNQYYVIDEVKQSVTYPTKEGLNRFDDLLLLVDANEKEDYRSTTPLAIKDEESLQTTLQINETTRWCRLEGVEPGSYVKVVATSSSKTARPVHVALYSGETLLASGVTGFAVTDRGLTAKECADLDIQMSAFEVDQEYGAKTSFAFQLSVQAGDEALVKTVGFSTLTKVEQKALNAALYQKQAATLPIYETNLGGELRLVGTLDVAVTAANKISAKFTGEEKYAFSGTWGEINLLSGKVTTALWKDDAVLNLAMDAEGGFSASITSAGGIDGSGASAAGDLSYYAGNYTVTLVNQAGSSGTGYLTVKVTNKGKASVSGLMPDGTVVSCSATLAPNADGTATLPVYKATKSATVAIALAIDAGAENTWGHKGEVDTVGRVANSLALWGETRFEVYGGYWKPGTTAFDICEMYDLSDELDVVAGGETNDVVKVTQKGFTVTKAFLTALTLNKSTGVFSGKAKVENSAGKVVSATVKGVLLPGWIDCQCGREVPIVERPYGSGTLYYKDNVDSATSTVSKPLDLVATEL